MKKILVDKHKIVHSFYYHDLIFKELMIIKDKLTLSIGNENVTTKITLKGLEFIEINELIPKGIVMSCYSFRINEMPLHLQDTINFDRMRQYVENNDLQVFYADGSMGFELMVAYSNGYSEEIDQ